MHRNSRTILLHANSYVRCTPILRYYVTCSRSPFRPTAGNSRSYLVVLLSRADEISLVSGSLAININIVVEGPRKRAKIRDFP